MQLTQILHQVWEKTKLKQDKKRRSLSDESPLTSEKPWKNCRMSAVVAVKGRPRMITKVPGRPEPLFAPPAAAAAAAATAAAAAAADPFAAP